MSMHSPKTVLEVSPDEFWEMPVLTNEEIQEAEASVLEMYAPKMNPPPKFTGDRDVPRQSTDQV